MNIRAAILLMATLVALSFPAMAGQQYKVVRYSNGTGFFVSNDGHLVTNAHVVDKCRWAQVSGDGMISRARILAKDTKNDMALLKASMHPGSYATFRPASYGLETGQKVVVVGHPLGKSLTTRSSELISNKGPMGEDQWVQFSNSVFQGNSGGPLLDVAGHVIGMIMAKATLYRYNPRLAKSEVVGNSDIAIQTHMLEAFLKDNGVSPRYSEAQIALSAGRIETKAKGFIVKVRCIVK